MILSRETIHRMTIKCQTCGAVVTFERVGRKPSGKRRYCSQICKTAARIARKLKSSPTDPPLTD